MAKSKTKKPKPKPPEGAKTVVAIRKGIAEKKEKLAKHKASATKDGKFDKFNPKYRTALKRVKRAQRKLQSEAYRLVPKKAPAAAAPAAEAPKAE